MSSNKKEREKLTFVSLILMIFTSVFGFANMPRSFYLMGYAAIPWYILSAITFFIPFAFMMSEYGAAFKDERGGIYSWMSHSVGSKYAFIGTFMWYASYIIWMVNVSSSIWIPFSNGIFGRDTTGNWSFFGLAPTQTLGLLGAAWIIFVTLTASRGLEKITRVTSIGGSAVALLNIALLIGALIVLVLSGGKLAQPVLSRSSFIQSPNPGYQSPVSVLSFLVFAIFSYGGIEVVGGLVDQTENAEVTFPKAITTAALIIAIGYSVGIFLTGIFTNWNSVLNVEGVHIGNAAYVVMQNLGYTLGQSFGLNEAASLTIGAWVARFVGLSMFLALTGAFFTLSYSPLKQIIEGTPSEIWPKKLTVIQDNMPKNAMWIQCIIVAVFILLISFGGEGAAQFFNKLILMTNVAMTLPYLFLSGAFASFKKRKEIKKPFEIFKTYGSALFSAVIVTFTVGFANFFTIIEPAQNGDIGTTLWMIAGPIFFTVVSLLLYGRYEKKAKNNKEKRKSA